MILTWTCGKKKAGAHRKTRGDHPQHAEVVGSTWRGTRDGIMGPRNHAVDSRFARERQPIFASFFRTKKRHPSKFRGSSAFEMALESLTDRKCCSSWQATQDQDLLVDIISDRPPQLLFIRSLPCWAGGVWNTSVWMNCCFLLIQNYTPVGHLEI